MSQEVCLRFLTAETRYRIEISLQGIFGGKGAMEHVLLQIPRLSSVSILQPLFHTYFFYTLLLPEGQTGKFSDPAKERCSLGNQKVLDSAFTFTVFLLL